jgi:hypothetical protein
VRSNLGFERMVRLGLVVYGLLHLLIAALSLRLALTGEATTSRGALAQVANDSWGLPVVLVLLAGFAGLTVWQLVAALVGYRDDEGRRRAVMRAGAACRVVTYGYLTYAIVGLLVHRHSPSQAGSGPSPRGASADVIAQPLGRLALGTTGLVIAGVGAGLAVFGATGQFLGQLGDDTRSGPRSRPIVALGYVGYIAKGAAFVVMGLLATWAGITDDPRKTGGLDQSLERLLGHTWGTAAIAAFGAGVGCFGLYLLARARYLRRSTLTA